MIRSMTGFGAAVRTLDGGTVAVEVKTVNHRHLNLSFRLPSGADAWESTLRATVSERIRRGHVSVLVSVDEAPGARSEWHVDLDRAKALVDAFRAVQEEHDLPGEIDLALVFGAGHDLLEERRPDALAWVDEAVLIAVTGEALEELIRMREEEGMRLAEDLGGRLTRIAAELEEIDARTPERLDRERKRLREAVGELVGEIRVDEERIEQEIVLLADRWDIGEEIVRSRSHVAAFRQLLESPGDEAVGKRCSFLVQELNREVNTIGSKGNDAEIARRVVEIKHELEKVREQVENIE